MTISDFIMLTAIYMPTPHSVTLSDVVMQESWNNICAINVNDELLYQPFMSKIERLERGGHDFAVNLGQIHAQNLRGFDISHFDVFVSCKNLKVIQTALTGCYKQTISKANFEQNTLQSALSFYNTENFKNGFTGNSVRKVVFHVAMENPVLSGGNSQEPVQLHVEEPNQAIKAEVLPHSSEELADVFVQKVSGAHDVFTVEYASFGKQQE